MSIASAITSLQSRVADAYTSVGNKGGTLPATQDTLHLPAAIASIPSGGSTKWGMSIEDICYTDNNGVAKMFSGVSGALSFTGVLNVADDGFKGFFDGCTGITSISFPALTQVTGSNAFSTAFRDCTSLTTVSFPELTTVSGNSAFSSTFTGCTNLTSVSFPELTTVSNSSISGGLSSAFSGCTSLTTVSFPELTTVSGTSAFSGTFVGCTNLTSVSFPKLSTITGTQVFSNAFGQGTSSMPASGVTSVSFPALTSIVSNASSATNAIFNNNKTLTRMDFPVLNSMKKTATATSNNLTYIFSNCTALAELHFGEDNQTVIEASDGYATKWGAPTTCTIYFDL